MPNAPTHVSNEILRRRLELSTLTKRLQHANDWMPRLQAQQPSLEPARMLESLHRRRHDLLRELSAAHRRECEALQKRPFVPKHPGEKAARPGLEALQTVGKKKAALESVFSSQGAGVTTSTAALQELLAGFCPSSTKILQTDFLDFKEYSSFEWKENKDEDVQFWKVFGLGSADDLTRSVLAWRAGIINPAPFDWPFIEERHDWAQLCINAAVTFDIPAPRCDSFVFYEASVVLGLSPHFEAEGHFLYSSCILCEQPDASQGDPTDLTDFELLGTGLTISGSTPDPQIESVDVARSFFVPKGVASKVHLGFTWNCNVASGEGGTGASCWNNFVIFRPAGGDIWGLKVTTVPVE